MSTSTGTQSESFNQVGPRLYDVPMKSYSALRNPFKDHHLYLHGKSFEFRAAMYDKFYQYPDYFTIVSEYSKQVMREIDVVLIPATNAWGFAHESVTQILKMLSPYFKKPVEQLVKQWIYETYLGEQPVGTSFLLEGKKKFVCWTCLSRTPDSIGQDYVYSYIWSAFSEINSFNHYRRLEDSSERIRKILIPDVTGLCNIYPTLTPIISQMSMAILSWTTSEQSEVTNTNIGVIRHNTIVQENIVDRKEIEQNLRGLIWSSEIGKRGLCSVQELDILVEWVESPTKQISVTSCCAICALLKRPDTEFTISQQMISERVMSTPGVLTTILKMAAEGTVKTHTEVKREDIETLKMVGEGTAGVVSAGRWNGTTVAVKSFNNNSDPKEFYREVSLLTLIKHKHIVSLHGASMDPNDPFLIEDLMEASLYDIIHCKTLELPESLKLHVAYGTAKGMRVLHNIGIIHRDLKSLNILISKNMVAKICDFGLSRVLDKSKSNMMTQNIGTVSWTAPEVFSKKGYTEKADVYSFGIICWELLTREKPFGDVAAFSVPLLVTKGERPPIPKDCSKEYKSFISKCWHKRPQQRPDFQKILETLLSLKVSCSRTLKKTRICLTRTKKGFNISSRAESSSSDVTQYSSDTTYSDNFEEVNPSVAAGNLEKVKHSGKKTTLWKQNNRLSTLKPPTKETQ
eukprot:TRINITY_DN5466_c0_g1_i1.p1 TRINITY_DN5466_c0_g1~~TRINITY_DN5466_c0_g1_i1.p1  ORF type:complete len:686 (+),score=105.96 TRINITY_DN5466_c0_g1_i1:16-2073(+)